MATRPDKTPVERVEVLLAELASSKLKRADAFSSLRARGREVTVEDARWGSLEMMANGAPRFKGRDPEVVRVELAIALKTLGVDYPGGE